MPLYLRDQASAGMVLINLCVQVEVLESTCRRSIQCWLHAWKGSKD